MRQARPHLLQVFRSPSMTRFALGVEPVIPARCSPEDPDYKPQNPNILEPQQLGSEGSENAHALTFLSVFAAPSMISFPTGVDPVNPTFRIKGWSVIAFPTTLPAPNTTFTTPGGNPALSVSSANLSAVSGVTWAGEVLTSVVPMLTSLISPRNSKPRSRHPGGTPP